MKNVPSLGALAIGALGGLYTAGMAAAARSEEIMAEIIYLTGATAEEISAAYSAYSGGLDGFRAEVLSGRLTADKIREMGNVA